MTAVQSLEKSGGPASNRWKPYPAYKPSGVEWLGDVPAGWDVKPARYGFDIQLGKMLQPDAGAVNDIELPYLKAQHVQWETVRTGDLLTMWGSKEDAAKFGVRDGDLLVCEGGDVGRAGIVKNPPARTIIQNALHRVRAKGESDLRILMYVLEHAASQGWFEILCNRATIAHFTGEKFGAHHVPLPPDPAEQRAIADFLDRETGKIDRLVAKKRGLIEKLKEERAALISRTVTRGLNPDAKLKPSGVEWLGDVPEKWDTIPLKWRARTRSGDGIATEDVQADTSAENPIPVIGGNGLMGYCAEGNVRGPVIVIGRVGALCGNVHHVTPPAWITDNALILTADPKAFDLSYLAAVLRMRNLNELADKTAQPLITGTRVRAVTVPEPPLPEQRAIADYLDRETGKIDRMAGKVEEAIARLQEYRAALITAAVTGKIDVRGEAAALEYPVAESALLKAAEAGAAYGGKNTDTHRRTRTDTVRDRGDVRAGPCLSVFSREKRNAP
jgi:type I restriction enzyme S subunit